MRAGSTLAALMVLASSCFVRADEHAQKVYGIGFVAPTSSTTFPPDVTAFWDRLRELGYVEGQNLRIESRWADGHLDRLPALMSEMVDHKVDVIVTYGTPAAIAAKGATTTIPIFNMGMGDPVATGLVASLARPGGNLTGISGALTDASGKWLELLQEVVPRLSTVAVFASSGNPVAHKEVEKLVALAPLRGLKLLPIYVHDAQALDQAFAQARRGSQAAIVLADSLFRMNQQRIITLAATHKLPAIYVFRDSVVEGGLMAYGPNWTLMFRRSADYVDKILKGAQPADIPIDQVTHYVLAVNLKTAKSLRVKIPKSILVRADAVIR